VIRRILVSAGGASCERVWSRMWPIAALVLAIVVAACGNGNGGGSGY
jgi:hypothetical protein